MSAAISSPAAGVTKIPARIVLMSLGACSEALKWAGSRRSPEEAWSECPRADWLLWVAVKVGVDRTLVVRAACDCARTALRYVPEGEARPLRAIETAEAWCDGGANLDDVCAAADTAHAAYAAHAHAAYAADAAAACAAYAAYAAHAHVAYAAYAAAAYAAVAAAAYADAYADATARSARTKAHESMAGLVRARIPFRVVAERARKAVQS